MAKICKQISIHYDGIESLYQSADANRVSSNFTISHQAELSLASNNFGRSETFFNCLKFCKRPCLHRIILNLPFLPSSRRGKSDPYTENHGDSPANIVPITTPFPSQISPRSLGAFLESCANTTCISRSHILFNHIAVDNIISGERTIRGSLDICLTIRVSYFLRPFGPAHI